MHSRIARRLHPPPQEDVAVYDLYSNLTFPTRGEDPLPYVYLNMVSSLDGRAETGGKASGIGSAADRLVMDTLRSKADAVMIGAGTLRAEKLTLGVSASATKGRLSNNLSPQPLAVIVAGASNISQAMTDNLLHAAPDNTLILAPRAHDPKDLRSLATKAQVILSPSERGNESLVDLRFALATIGREHGVQYLLVEGGPSLNGLLISSGLVHELFLTLSPKLLETPTEQQAAHETPRSITTRPDASVAVTAPTPTPSLGLISTYLIEDELFLRYSLSPPANPNQGNQRSTP